MISAWKKFINKSPLDNEQVLANGYSATPSGIHKLGKDLQRKFAKGINYNMKVIIKGDNKVGKTCLLLRLKGYGFEESYSATESLNVTSIDWSYKATDDVVKIDLWEVVDSASKRSVNFVDLKVDNSCPNNPVNQSNQTKGSNGFQNTQANPTSKVVITSTQLIQNGNGNHISPIPESAKQCLSELSESLDVYKGADAVLMVMDMTKLWTFKYVQNELPKIPKHLPVLVIANNMDQGHHRTVAATQVRSFLEAFPRGPGDGTLMYTETSMKNGFGMRLIEKFFNIPFLKLQETSLQKQLELNKQEGLATHEELKILQESIEREYEQYLELQTIRRRQQADAMSPVNSGLRQLDDNTREQIRSSNLSRETIDKRQAHVTSIESEETKPSPHIPTNFINDRLPSIVIGAKCPLADIRPNLNVTQSQSISNTNEQNIEASDDSDDDEEPRANPLVANYQSDVDSDDQIR